MEVIALEAGSEPPANDYEGRVTGQGYRFQIEVLWPNGRPNNVRQQL
jgi:hypothetical protein